MFRHHHSPGFQPAWAGASPEQQFFAKDDFRHRGSRRGWGEPPRKRRGEIRFILLELLSERPQHGYDLLKGLESEFVVLVQVRSIQRFKC
ncbi:MAG: hypothetical protein ACRDEA_07250 [Microcystaceae cyanobacterium]